MDDKWSAAEVAAVFKGCVRCGQVYRDVDNHDAACHYHPGRLRDYDSLGQPGCGAPGDFWDCCRQQIVSYNEAVPGCAVGRHVSPITVGMDDHERMIEEIRKKHDIK